MATWLALELEADRTVGAGALAAKTLANTGDAFAERLQLAYADRVRSYLDEVNAFYARAINGGHRRADRFPELTLQLPLGVETVAFDADLDIQLLQLYALHGWPGVVALEAAVNERRNYPPMGLAEPWAEAQTFLRVVRYLLTLRIRSSLISIESIARSSISNRLGRSAKALDDAIAMLDIRRKPIDFGRSGARGGPGSTEVPTTTTIGNRDLLADIHQQFDQILRGNRALERMRLDLQILEANIGAARRSLQQKTEGASGGVELPSELAQREEHKTIEALEAERRALARDSIDTEQILQRLSESLGELATPLFLAIPQLHDGFSLDDTERAISETFFSLRNRIDALDTAIKNEGGAIPVYLPFDPAELRQMDRAALVSVDACAQVVAIALETSTEHPARLAMLSEEALLSALSGNEIEQGSLEHIVTVHYLAALLDGLEERRKNEKAVRTVAQGLASLGAALSLSSLVVSRVPNPQAQGAAGTMRLLGRVLELPMVLYFAYSTLHQLRQLDEALDQRLAATAFDSLEAVAQLAQIDAFRNGFVTGIGTEIGKLLIENIAAGQLTALKKLILMRGYFDDLATLLPADEGEDG